MALHKTESQAPPTYMIASVTNNLGYGPDDTEFDRCKSITLKGALREFKDVQKQFKKDHERKTRVLLLKIVENVVVGGDDPLGRRYAER